MHYSQEQGLVPVMMGVFQSIETLKAFCQPCSFTWLWLVLIHTSPYIAFGPWSQSLVRWEYYQFESVANLSLDLVES